jgi:hypothetical protein
MKLTAQNVEQLFLACLFKEGEDTSKAVTVHSVMMKVGFHPERLEENHFAITELLLQCHENFMETSEAQGYSFLAFCEDKNGEQWTGMHSVCDNLICLGLAIEKVVFLLPREFWHALPGGMPYIQIKNVLSNEA